MIETHHLLKRPEGHHNQGQSNTNMKFDGNAHLKNMDNNGSTEIDRSKGDTINYKDKKSKKPDSKRKRGKLEEATEDTNSDSSSDKR